MPKFQLLLLDAGIVIGLHEIGIWNKFIELYSVTVTSTVVDEVLHWKDDEGEIVDMIDLKPDICSGKVKCVDVPISVVKKFCEQFVDRIDPGEAESLAYLCNSKENWLITSSDYIVYKILGCLGRAEQGISLEEILQQVGLSHSLHWKYTRRFRERYTKLGQQDSITGLGLK